MYLLPRNSENTVFKQHPYSAVIFINAYDGT